MPGVRVHHRKLRNQTLVFELPDRPYPVPFLCSTCESTHLNKAIHLRFDGSGDVVVAEEAWDTLRPYLGDQVVTLGLVSDPEPMVLGVGAGHEAYQVVRTEV